MANLLALAKRMETAAAEVAEIGASRKVEVATIMLEYLTDQTPVDTSKAISEWQIGMGRPVNSEVEAYAKGKRGSTKSVSRAAAIHVGKEKLLAAKPGQPVYLSNLAGYIGFLNRGSSSQHPGGFVEAAILIAKRTHSAVRLVRVRK